MAVTVSAHRRPAPVRRAGYATATVVYAALLCAVNVWPGWQALPFLTGDTRQVLGLVNIWLIAGLVFHVEYQTYDAPRARSLGDVVTTGIGIAALVRVWQVFPFTFAASAAGSAVVRLVLAVAIASYAIGTVAHLAALVVPRRRRRRECRAHTHGAVRRKPRAGSTSSRATFPTASDPATPTSTPSTSIHGQPK